MTFNLHNVINYHKLGYSRLSPAAHQLSNQRTEGGAESRDVDAKRRI